jgi:hypothetical protein
MDALRKKLARLLREAEELVGQDKAGIPATPRRTR